MGNLVERVAAYRPKVIGIDYILDRSRNPDQTEILIRAIQTANTQGIEFVLGAIHNQGVWEIALPELINNNQLGDIGARTYYMDLPFPEDEIDSLSYTLAQTYQTNWQTGRTRRSLITSLSYAFGSNGSIPSSIIRCHLTRFISQSLHGNYCSKLIYQKCRMYPSKSS